MAMKGTISAIQKSYDNWNTALTDNNNRVQAGYAPYSTAGTTALAGLQDPANAFAASPDYQYRLDQGLDAVTQSHAVGGMLHSGATLQDLQTEGQGQASNEFGNWWDRQSGLAGMGLHATGAAAQAGTDYTNQFGNNAVNKWNTTYQLKSDQQAKTNALVGSVVGGVAGAMSGNWGSVLSNLGGMFGATGGAPAASGGGSVAKAAANWAM